MSVLIYAAGTAVNVAMYAAYGIPVSLAAAVFCGLLLLAHTCGRP